MKFCLRLLALVFLTFPVFSADVRLNLSRAGSEADLELVGEPGTEYLIEAATGSADHWKAHSSFVLTDPSRIFRENNVSSGNRFFRARAMTEDDAQFVENFRLIDHTGKARELFYYRTLNSLTAIVLIFSDGNYAAFADKIKSLKSQSIFANSVLFWQIETGASNSRTNIAREAAAAGITWPIMHDPLQLVMRDVGAAHNGEVLVLRRQDFRVLYRGLIEDSTNAYLAAALTNLAQFDPLVTTRIEPSASPVSEVSRSIADYSTVIAPILQRRCVICHSPDNIAPFALTNYESVVEHADEIHEEVMARNMPPWHADPLYGKFTNDLSLSPLELSQLVDWIHAGLPRGTGADPLTDFPAAPPKWPAELGEPDQIVTVPVQDIPASGTLAYRYIYANATNTEDRWLRAAIVRPSNRRVVHHYIVWEGHSTFAQLSGIAGYAPGRTEAPMPSGTGILLKKQSPLTFNLHYTASGQAETDQPELALWYASAPPARQLKTVATLNTSFTFGLTPIPAGNPEFEISAANTFSAPVRLYSFSPHMHFRGLRMRFDLVLPNSTAKQTLLSVPNYNFDWQTIYYLQQPLDLPAGSRIEVVGAFDNSPQNVNNPNPGIAVRWGEQSWDEMFIGYMEYSDQ